MSSRLKSLLPNSLFGRAALILVLPIITVQLIVSVAFIQRHFEGVTQQMTGAVIIEMKYMLQMIAAEPDQAKAQVIASDVSKGLDLRVRFPVSVATLPKADSRTFFDLSGRRVILTLREDLKGVLAVDLTSNPTTARIYLQSSKGLILVEMSRGRVAASNPHQLLVWMVLTSALMTLISFLFMRNQLSPIIRLAAAAEAFGKGQNLPYTLRGSTEVRAAGSAFLNMRSRIERQIESRTLMLSGVSHDLRTPLTRLKLGLSFLPEDDDTRALQQDVTDMERLVDEFLAFARGDAMEATELTDAAALLARVVENATRMGQAVTLGRVDTPVMIKLRPQAVQRALENLIGNAVRHGSRAEVSLTKGERFLRFVVEDDGPGIAKARRDEAMEPFRRLDAARDPNRGGGVGLGLSIALDIARSHGGGLHLGESESLGGLRAELAIAL